MEVQDFIRILGVDFYTGVPDSLLRPLCDYLYMKYGVDDPCHHVVAANEGNAAGIASGYFLATGKIPVIYMQNSGEGNIVNPLTSLLSYDVYGIPVIFVIGWRGEPGVKDECQHVQQGRITLELLETLDVPYIVIGNSMTLDELRLKMRLLEEFLHKGRQVALIIEKSALNNEMLAQYNNCYQVKRESFIRSIVGFSGDGIIVSTTGKTSRELFEIREEVGNCHSRDFLTVGSMGHASSIALGIALQKPNKKVWCIDGDGAMLMHMGAMAVIGKAHPLNFVHIVINNGAHESVGGMPTAAFEIDCLKVADGCGYDTMSSVDSISSLEDVLRKANQEVGLHFIEIKCAIGSRKDLGRPTITPQENKTEFMKYMSTR